MQVYPDTKKQTRNVPAASPKDSSQPSWPVAIVLGLVISLALVAAVIAVVSLYAQLNTAMSDVHDSTGQAGTSSPHIWTTWDEETAPNYYRIVGAAERNSFESLTAPEVRYSALDALGRAGRASACISYEMMREGLARERSDMHELEPSGWGYNEKVTISMPNGNDYHGFLYNRSHLIAKSLGGADELVNLVCGTRTQNVGSNDGEGGMAYVEQLARNWLGQHPHRLLYYAATPIYEGDELMCRSVVIDILADDGSIDARFEVYNAAKGFELNYANGSFTALTGLDGE